MGTENEDRQVLESLWTQLEADDPHLAGRLKRGPHIWAMSPFEWGLVWATGVMMGMLFILVGWASSPGLAVLGLVMAVTSGVLLKRSIQRWWRDRTPGSSTHS